MSAPTLLDIVKTNTGDVMTGLIDDVTVFAPETNTFASRARAGTNYKITRYNAVPSGAFRGANSSVAVGKPILMQELKEMQYFDSPMQVDEMIVKADERTLGDFLALYSRTVLQGSTITIGNATWYGDGSNNNILGLRAQLTAQVKAGGTTNTTSAYLIWMDADQGVSYDIGKNGQFLIPPWIRQMLPDPKNSAQNLFYYVSNLSAFIGLSVKSANSVFAITGCAPTGASNNLTDALASSLFAKVPISRRNNLRWFMNRDNEYQLRQSRTAITYQPANASGIPAYSEAPNGCLGFPITITDSIVSTETNS